MSPVHLPSDAASEGPSEGPSLDKVKRSQNSNDDSFPALEPPGPAPEPARPVPELARVEQPVASSAPIQLSPSEVALQTPAHVAPMIVPPGTPTTQTMPATQMTPATQVTPPTEMTPKSLVSDDLPSVVSEPLDHSRFSKVDETVPISPRRPAQPTTRLLKSNLAESWLPPVLLDAWRRGNRGQRSLLGGAAVAGVGIFVLIFASAVSHVQSTPSQASQGNTPPVSSRVNVASTDKPPAPIEQLMPVPHPTVRPQPDPPPTTALDYVAGLFGYQSDKSFRITRIDKDRVGVQVWTSKSNGYYYCTDDPYYKSVQPGNFRTQGDALQSGYRPKLGQFCD